MAVRPAPAPNKEPLVPESQLRELLERGARMSLWPKDLSPEDQRHLAYAAVAYGLDPFLGDLLVLGGKPYVSSGGLRRLAEDRQAHGIHLALHQEGLPEYLLDAQGRIQWAQEGNVFRPRVQPGTGWSCWRAELKKSPTCGGFVEFGEASFDDVGLKRPTWKDVRAMARTRAANRAIRLAYALGLTSVEELTFVDGDGASVGAGTTPPPSELAEKPARRSAPAKRATELAAPQPEALPAPDPTAVPVPEKTGAGADQLPPPRVFAGTFAVVAAPEERADSRGKTARVPVCAVDAADGVLGAGERAVLWSRLGDDAVRAQILALEKGARVSARGLLTARTGHLAVTEVVPVNGQ
ncbi:MAG TPA: hypothetical protein DEQ28_08750 [Clostridiales bacterium]|nr:hypothetical protein [Clostridiales bacterium]